MQISGSLLKKVVSVPVSIAKMRSPDSISDMIALRISDDSIVCEAWCGNISAHVEAVNDIGAEKEVGFLVNAVRMLDVLKAFGGDNIKIAIDGNRLTLIGTSMKYSLDIMSLDDWVTIQRFPEDVAFLLESRWAQFMWAHGVCADTDSSSPRRLDGLFLIPYGDGQLRVAATEGHMAAVSTVPVMGNMKLDDTEGGSSIYISRSVLPILSVISSDVEVAYAPEISRMFFRACEDDLTIDVSTVTERRDFLPIDSLTYGEDLEFTVGNDNLTDMIKKASVVVKGDPDNTAYIVVRYLDERVVLSAQSSNGTADVVIKTDGINIKESEISKYENGVVGFNPKFMLSVLSLMGESVKVQCGGELAIRLTDMSESANVVGYVMPVRLR